ncbi:DsrE family protein [Thiohalobacter sp. IOR34]|uniref:DsrE family protein n=1 Tax=Thiohalobacter sp. IOR34 TaxID=3057176 RepID=UPI0025AF18EF|nr:DsrE family protein [Thiohalobacter sp. IOR34]WJW74282.1 DsrE family protein [Thiohalobacter sp. IOR34]
MTGLAWLLGAWLLCPPAGLSAGEPAAQIEFPNIPHLPLPEGIGFDGFFETHNPVRIVFGVSDPGSQLKESLTNAAYTIKYLKPRDIPYEIELVLYGRAVLAANSFNEKYGGYAPLIEALHAQGVTFSVCNNSLAHLGEPADDLYDFMRIIPAGILQLTRRQMQGYAYISNPVNR